MNICFYTDFAISSMTGGIGRMTTVLTNYFRKMFGWKVYSIFAFHPSSDCILTEIDGSIQLRLHDRLGFRPLSGNYEQASLFIKNNNIQVIIIQTSMDVTAKLKMALNQRGLDNVKLITTLHYSPGTDEFLFSFSEMRNNLTQRKNILKSLSKAAVSPIFNHLEHRATIRAYRNAYKYGDLTILLSDSYIPIFKKYASLYETTKLITIPNCLPFHYSLTNEDICSKKKTALMVGRIVEFPKRVSSILNIWQIVEKDSSANDWNLTIVGDGPDLEIIKKKALSLNLKRINFTGRQNPFTFYLDSSIFIMTSEFEGFPMTLVEAEQMGCVPIVFNSFSSLKEVVTNNVNGCIIPNNDIEKFAETVLDLMHNSDKRMKMMKNGFISCKKYNQEFICTKWKTIIDELSNC